MELDDNGFLGEQVGDWSREFRKRYGSLLNRCKQLNWDAHSLLHSVEVHTKDGREILSRVSLCERSNSTKQRFSY